jgi:thiamine-monophosphate kinase
MKIGGRGVTDHREQQRGEQRPMDEFELIKTVSQPFRRYEKRQILVPNGDDAAVYLPAAEKGQVVCVDTLVEEIHFKRKTMEPYHIGYKSLAVNLSDMAAMGGTPLSFLVSLAIPPQWSYTEIEQIYRGMKTLADQYELDLLGGDTVSSPQQLMLSVTLLGEVDAEVKLLRSNARPGDVVFVTGMLGESAGGLHLLLQPSAEKERERFAGLVAAHQLPQAHVAQGKLLALLGKKHRLALNDVSDGLASEASEIAQSSGVNVIIDQQRLPLSAALREYALEAGQDVLRWALYGGEDFVLLGSTAPSVYLELENDFQAMGFPLYPIGTVTEGNGEVYLEQAGQRQLLREKGFNHFRPAPSED